MIHGDFSANVAASNKIRVLPTGPLRPERIRGASLYNRAPNDAVERAIVQGQRGRVVRLVPRHVDGEGQAVLPNTAGM